MTSLCVRLRWSAAEHRLPPRATVAMITSSPETMERAPVVWASPVVHKRILYMPRAIPPPLPTTTTAPLILQRFHLIAAETSNAGEVWDGESSLSAARGLMGGKHWEQGTLHLKPVWASSWSSPKMLVFVFWMNSFLMVVLVMGILIIILIILSLNE